MVNGTRGTVAHVDPHLRTVTIDRHDGAGQVVLPPGYVDAGQLDHGYAVTAHKAQGLTAGATWVLGTDALYREWGYVALSRGRQSNRLYLVAGPDPEPDGHPSALAPPQGDPLRRLAGDLTRSRAQRLATDHPPARHAELDDRQLADLAARLRADLLAAARTEPAGERDRLTARRDQLAARRNDLAARRDSAASGRRRWRRRRPDRQPGPTKTDRSEAAVVLVDRQVADLDRRLTELPAPVDDDRSATAAEAWRAIDAEIERRAAVRAVAAGVDPPAYLTGLLGERPNEPAACQVWDDAVRAVEAYRLRHQVDDPAAPLGGRPDDLAGRRDPDHAAALVAAARHRLLDPPHRQPEAVDHDLAI